MATITWGSKIWVEYNGGHKEIVHVRSENMLQL